MTVFKVESSSKDKQAPMTIKSNMRKVETRKPNETIIKGKTTKLRTSDSSSSDSDSSSSGSTSDSGTSGSTSGTTSNSSPSHKRHPSLSGNKKGGITNTQQNQSIGSPNNSTQVSGALVNKLNKNEKLGDKKMQNIPIRDKREEIKRNEEHYGRNYQNRETRIAQGRYPRRSPCRDERRKDDRGKAAPVSKHQSSTHKKTEVQNKNHYSSGTMNKVLQAGPLNSKEDVLDNNLITNVKKSQKSHSKSSTRTPSPKLKATGGEPHRRESDKRHHSPNRNNLSAKRRYSGERKDANSALLASLPDTKPTKLHVGRLTRHVTTEHLKEIFGNYGQIKSIEMPQDRNHTNYSRGFAYVEFENHEEAEKAQKFMNSGQIDGQEISVAFVLTMNSVSGSVRQVSTNASAHHLSTRKDGVYKSDRHKPSHDQRRKEVKDMGHKSRDHNSKQDPKHYIRSGKTQINDDKKVENKEAHPGHTNVTKRSTDFKRSYSRENTLDQRNKMSESSKSIYPNDNDAKGDKSLVPKDNIDTSKRATQMGPPSISQDSKGTKSTVMGINKKSGDMDSFLCKVAKPSSHKVSSKTNMNDKKDKLNAPKKRELSSSSSGSEDNSSDSSSSGSEDGSSSGDSSDSNDDKKIIKTKAATSLLKK